MNLEKWADGAGSARLDCKDFLRDILGAYMHPQRSGSLPHRSWQRLSY